MANVLIDGKEIIAKSGANLLWTALDNGFYIPNLCNMRETNNFIASCRMCLVEIKGRKIPVTACTEKVYDGMVVRLDTDKVKKIRNTSFELLLSNHDLDCNKCGKNKNCELQKVASKLHIKLKLNRLKQINRKLPVDTSHALFYYNPNRCILCGKCIWTCRENKVGIIDFAFRGIDTKISTFAAIPFAETLCTSCLACVSVCPVGALVSNKEQNLNSEIMV